MIYFSNELISFGALGGSGGGVSSYLSLTDTPPFIRTNSIITPAVVTPVRQWVQSATTTSDVYDGIDGVVGAPDTGTSLGDDETYKSDTVADRVDLIVIELNYAQSVNVEEVIVRELFGSRDGSLSLIQALNGENWVNIYENNGTTQIGGATTGANPGKVSDQKITLTTKTAFLTNKLRITIDSRSAPSVWNVIDAVELVGSTTVEEFTTTTYELRYSDLTNKPTIPTLPTNATSAEIQAKTGTVTRLFTPLQVATIASSYVPETATNTEIQAKTGTTARLFTPLQVATIADSLVPASATASEITAADETEDRLLSPKDITDISTSVATTLISEIPAQSTSSGSYFDLTDKPAFIRETVTPERTLPAVEFIPTPNPDYQLGVNITDNGGTIATTAGDGWDNSGTFSTDSITGDGYVTARAVNDTAGKYYAFGLSDFNTVADATSHHRNTIDYMIYLHARTIVIQENGTIKGTFTYEFESTYKIQRTGTVITYLKDDVVFYTSTKASPTTSALHMDVSFWSSSTGLKDIRMFTGVPVVEPRTVTYQILQEDITGSATESFEGIIKNLVSTDFTKTYNTDGTIATIINNGNVTQTFTYTTVAGKQLVSKILLSGDGLPDGLTNNAKNFIYNAAGLETSVTYTPN